MAANIQYTMLICVNRLLRGGTLTMLIKVMLVCECEIKEEWKVNCFAVHTMHYIMHLSIVSPTTSCMGKGWDYMDNWSYLIVKFCPFNGEFDFYILSYTVDFYIWKLNSCSGFRHLRFSTTWFGIFWILGLIPRFLTLFWRSCLPNKGKMSRN